MATQKTSFMHKLCDLLLDAIAIIVRTMLKFDRYVLKRYLGIETPIYKLWWKNHVSEMQRRLDYSRKTYHEYNFI